MSINRSLHRIAKEGVVQTLEAKDKEIERLHSIINEVREYIELGMNFDSLGVVRTKKKLLEILDKENEK